MQQESTPPANSRQGSSQESQFWERKSNWLIPPLVLFTLVFLYTTVRNSSSLAGLFINFSFSNIIFMFTFWPFMTYLLFSVFGVTYLYKALRGHTLRKTAQVIGWIFTGLGLLVLLYLVSGFGSSCSGIFSVQQSCVENHYFIVFLIFLYSCSLWNALALTGIIALLLEPRKANKL
ncbi:MAG TPA: hypothetical protein VJ841_00285 [Candidatus Saccharimonadales bacterium]|nr:hypothetical protein [Candidatus Saccharimonadales bacterium]